MMFFDTSSVGPGSAIVPTQLSTALASGYVLWMLQRAKSVPWVSQATVKLNVVLRLIASGASTIGISIAWQPVNHQLIIGNLSLGTVILGLYHLGVQYAATHASEKVMNIIPSTAIAEPKKGVVVPTTEVAPPKVGA